jgi:hypothetical protein
VAAEVVEVVVEVAAEELVEQGEEELGEEDEEVEAMLVAEEGRRASRAHFSRLFSFKPRFFLSSFCAPFIWRFFPFTVG